jgi:hypothetical protein
LPSTVTLSDISKRTLTTTANTRSKPRAMPICRHLDITVTDSRRNSNISMWFGDLKMGGDALPTRASAGFQSIRIGLNYKF